MTTEFETQLFMFDKTHTYYEAFKEFCKTTKDPQELLLAKSIMTLMERYCTCVKTSELDKMKFTKRLAFAFSEYKNQKKLETLEQCLDQYVEKKKVKSTFYTKYKITSISKIPQKIKSNIIEAANKKPKVEMQLERQTKKL